MSTKRCKIKKNQLDLAKIIWYSLTVDYEMNPIIETGDLIYFDEMFPNFQANYVFIAETVLKFAEELNIETVYELDELDNIEDL